VTIYWLRPGLPPLVETPVLPASARQTIYLNQVPGLSAMPVGASIEASVPVLAERAMYWPGDAAWLEGHASAGSRHAGTAWLFADAEVGGPQNMDTQLQIANPGTQAASTVVTLLREDAPPIVLTPTIAARSRSSLSLNALGLASGERFGILLESSAPIVAERTTYWEAEGWRWRAGTSSTGVRLR
jgi:hypothetical protein